MTSILRLAVIGAMTATMASAVASAHHSGTMFDDKKQVYLEVTRRTLVEAYHRIMDRLVPQRFVGMDWQATIRNAIEVILDQATRHPALHKTFVEMSLRDPHVLELRRAFDKISHERLAAVIAAISSSAWTVRTPKFLWRESSWSRSEAGVIG